MMPAAQTGMTLRMHLSSSTCCSGHNLHGFAEKPSWLILSSSVIIAALSKNLHNYIPDNRYTKSILIRINYHESKCYIALSPNYLNWSVWGSLEMRELAWGGLNSSSSFIDSSGCLIPRFLAAATRTWAMPEKGLPSGSTFT